MVCGGATGRPVPHFAVSYAVPQLSFAVRAVRAVPSCACCALVARQLGVVDTFGSSSVSTFISPGNLRIMVMYDGAKSEDALKHFFTDVHALYLKHLLNPFYKPHTAIESPEFDARVKALARRYLGAKDL